MNQENKRVWKGIKNTNPEIFKYFHECFELDKNKGTLLWKERPLSHFKREIDWKRHLRLVGKIAGHNKWGRNTFYRRVKLLGSTIECHIICWCMYYNKFPDSHIDHIDGDGLNNSKINLRDNSNKKNKVVAESNKSGIVGVYWNENKQRWIATGERKQLATSKSLFDMACVRKSWELVNGYTPRQKVKKT